MKKQNLKELFKKFSLIINNNLFTLIIYYCVALVLLSLLIDKFLGDHITKSKFYMIDNIALGITLGFLHKFIFLKKNKPVFQRVVLGLFIIVLSAIIYVIIVRLL